MSLTPEQLEARRKGIASIRKTTREEYDAIRADNWSKLKHLSKSPAHYLREITNPSTDDTEAKQRGRVLHLAVFEPERFAEEVVVFHERRAGRGWDAFEMAHAGKEIINSRMAENVKAIAGAVRKSPMAAPYLSRGKAEMTVTWRHDSPEVGLPERWSADCKGRVDFISEDGIIVDLKTTRDASPGGFAREVMRYEHHVQAAFYADGVKAATGRGMPFVFVAVESAAPHVVQVYRVPEEVMELGRERYRLLLSQLHICRSESRWHGYAEAEMELTLPRWARPQDDDDAFDADLVIGE